jgi:uncharacterized protein
VKKLRRFGREEIEVIFRKSKSQEEVAVDPVTRFIYPPPITRTVVENGIRKEIDVPVLLRDGTMIYVDVYRPDVATKVPAIVAWSPYGKFESYGERLQLPIGVPPGTISSMAKFESPDPGYWCHNEYAIINVDVRGSGNSGGEVLCFGTQDGRDGYDVIEWIAKQEWCNGKVAMAGVSWVAMAQWYVAAERPPHLMCFALGVVPVISIESSSVGGEFPRSASVICSSDGFGTHFTAESQDPALSRIIWL